VLPLSLLWCSPCKLIWLVFLSIYDLVPNNSICFLLPIFTITLFVVWFFLFFSFRDKKKKLILLIVFVKKKKKKLICAN
jgi:uncharacterized RDD family membrane protein YckC